MEKRSLTLTALLVASLAGNVYLLDKGASVQVAVVDAASIEGVEVRGGAKQPFAQAYAESGAQGALICKAGVIANLPPEVVYCADGGTAGFVLDAQVAEDLMAETGTRTGGLRLAVDGGGKVIAY